MPNLTETQIIAMAESLTEANGRTPTWQELRNALGSGSTATINKYYSSWRKKKDAELASKNSDTVMVVEKLPIPESVAEALVTAWSTSVAIIKAESQRELEAVQSMFKAETESLKAELDERDKIIDILEAESVEKSEQSAQAIDSANSQIDVLRNELTVKSAELATLSGRNIELEKQLSISSDSLRTERNRTEQAQAEVVTLKTKLDFSEKEVARLSAKVRT